jgi:tRNA-uridine 2-sulfurtransferase
MNNLVNNKVYVGLSGGVDSAVSAYLLKSQGYDVTGVYIKGYQPDWIECMWKEDRISAMRSAAHLDIPFVTLDGEEAYRQNVVSYMLDEYSKGRTPNGDMLCNREIKFGIFLKFALESGADFVATGHYAQNIFVKNNKENKFELVESKDKQKDQTYFLSQLTQNELKYILFPIGHLQKSEVRQIARKNNLPVATRKDSQGICFVGDMSMQEFLTRELSPKKGKVLNEQGQEIGEHDGAILYTIGQRHGFRVGSNTEKQTNLYIHKKDIKNNLVYVRSKSSNNEVSIDSNRQTNILNLNQISFIGDVAPKGESINVRVRYRGEMMLSRFIEIDLVNKTANLEILDSKSVEIAEGQFVVFYDKDKCLGGGVFTLTLFR